MSAVGSASLPAGPCMDRCEDDGTSDAQALVHDAGADSSPPPLRDLGVPPTHLEPPLPLGQPIKCGQEEEESECDIAGMSFIDESNAGLLVLSEEDRQRRDGARYTTMRRGGQPNDAGPSGHTDATSTTSTHPSPTSRAKRTPLKISTAAAASRFSFITSSMSALKGLASPVSKRRDGDHLLHLDIEAALFPSGPAVEDDALSPAAFRNFQSSAVSLLHQFQSVYQEQVREFKAEREVQYEDKFEAETRNQHLKMQLERMAQTATENEAAMQALTEELRAIKKLRMEEQAARERDEPSSALPSTLEAAVPSTMSSTMSVSEDLGVDDDRRRSDRRRSSDTTKSDLSSDMDEDSIEGGSVFSRSRSPTVEASVSDVGFVDNTPPLPPLPTERSTPSPCEPSKQAQPPISAFQKLFKRKPGEPRRSDYEGGRASCGNCHGQDASVAWDTVGVLRVENRILKQRVTELESVVEEALDAVNGVGL
ncbi:hypothetical protein RJ55_04177 [Drechmeria coniospora]|nr:hypothetical protein RJ55_04177 [Drechmeria coniospora]